MNLKKAAQDGTSFRERINPTRACMRLWYVMVMGARANILTPNDLPSYRTEERAWRVLIIGNGPTHGWGVSTHKDSLVGQLAVTMRALRNQPVDVDYIGDEMMNAQTASHWLANAPLNKYDQIIVAIGWNDAVRFTPDQIWQQSMNTLLNDIHRRRSATARVIVLGIEPITATSGYGGLPGRIAQHTANRFNKYLQELVLRNEDVYVPLAARVAGKEARIGTVEVYQKWAEQISAVAAPLLPGKDPGRRIVNGEPVFHWIGTKRALGFDGSNTPQRLNEITQKAKDHFKVHLAQINILDGDKQWFPNHTGPTPNVVPRELTYCDTAAEQDGIFIVPNGKKDPRFKDNEFLDQIHMPFYAGQALRSRSGEVVATFCLMDVLPRPQFALNRAKFEEFAASAQEAVWQIEDESIAAANQ